MDKYILVYEYNSVADNVIMTIREDYETEEDLHKAVNSIFEDKENKLIVAGYLQKEFTYKPVTYAVKYEPIDN